MPIIPKQKLNRRLTRLNLKLPELVLQQLQPYSRFIESSQGHVIVESLPLTFPDPEFQTWLQANPPQPRPQRKAPATPKTNRAEKPPTPFPAPTSEA